MDIKTLRGGNGMKIIKEGDLNRLKRIKRFECTRCGCVFEAAGPEYDHGIEYGTVYYFCKCPTCGNMSHEIPMERREENEY